MKEWKYTEVVWRLMIVFSFLGLFGVTLWNAGRIAGRQQREAEIYKNLSNLAEAPKLNSHAIADNDAAIRDILECLKKDREEITRLRTTSLWNGAARIHVITKARELPGLYGDGETDGKKEH